MIEALVAWAGTLGTGEAFVAGMVATVLIALVATALAWAVGAVMSRYGVLVRVEVYDKRRRRATAYNAYAGYNQAR